MTLDKILVGCSKAEFTKEIFPFYSTERINFASSPESLVNFALTKQYREIVSFLGYTPGGEEGLDAMEKITNVVARKILLTDDVTDEILNKASELGVYIRGSFELDTLVGVLPSLVESEKILLYCPSENTVYRALKQVMKTLLGSEIVVGSNLDEELDSCRYGLVIDASTIGMDETKTGEVSQALCEDSEVPIVKCVYRVSTLLSDILKNIGYFKDFRSER